MNEQKITAEMKVSKVVKEHPETIEAFLGHGCPDMRKGIFPIMARVMSVRRAAWIHKIPLEELLRDLNESVARSSINTEALRQMLDRGKPVTVLDIRHYDEHAEWSISGSINFDAYDALKAKEEHAMDGADLSKDEPVVTVCGRGHTSAVAADQLRSQGYEAYSLEGGMGAWSLAWNTAEVEVAGSPAEVVQMRRAGKGCLSYMIASGGEAAVIDAAVDPQVYLELAEERDLEITRVLDTHVHADHLSRSRRLAELCGAELLMPADSPLSYPFAPISDGDVLKIGEAELEAISTPGHTPESTSYLLDGAALFSGDTLFLSAVGRPDLGADKEQARRKAATLHGSLRRLLGLPAATLVLPGHTAEPPGFDGRPVTAPLGEVHARTEILDEPEESFVKRVAGGGSKAPENHERIVSLNRAGELPEGDPTELEGGANRCAAG